MPRRDFLAAMGTAAGGLAMASGAQAEAPAASQPTERPKSPATVRAAFFYPSSESLKKAGYYSWPGSGFDAEGRQKEYMPKIAALAGKLNMRIPTDARPLTGTDEVGRFIREIKRQPPDGLLLIPFKKSEWSSILRVIDETKLPTVVLVSMGVLLAPQMSQLHRKPGVYLICSLDNFEAVESGMRMIRTARWMREARILSIGGTETKETTVAHLGTQIRAVPHARFGEEYRKVPADGPAQQVAEAYVKNAQKVVEPSPGDVLEAARATIACRRILETEKADVLMMDCLGGIQKKLFPPPCMGYMTLRDEGIVMGCQNDLDATLTMMLVQQLFDRPGFQQNASCETERNLYYASHCTCPTKLNGPGGASEPYILRNHAEAGVGTVPQVFWRIGQEVTMAHYLSGKEPEMLLYSGKVVRCYDQPPAGGCRTNVEITLNEIADVVDVKGMHQTLFYGDYVRPMKAFCQLYGIKVTV